MFTSKNIKSKSSFTSKVKKDSLNLELPSIPTHIKTSSFFKRSNRKYL